MELGADYDPIETLIQEHREYEKRVALVGVAFAPDRDPHLFPDDARAVAGFARFFEEEVEGIHGRKEESALFPALRRYLPSPGPIEVMIADHLEMRQNQQSMLKGAEKLRSDSEDVEARALMAGAGRTLVEFLALHIHKEDDVLFPTARNVLEHRELEEIAEVCLEIEKSRRG